MSYMGARNEESQKDLTEAQRRPNHHPGLCFREAPLWRGINTGNLPSYFKRFIGPFFPYQATGNSFHHYSFW